jgi:hypothetical protein
MVPYNVCGIAEYNLRNKAHYTESGT